MKLRKIILILDQSFGAKESSIFNFQARSIGYFIGRSISKLRIETQYAQLVIAAQSGNLPSIEKYFPQSLLVRVKFDIDKYRELNHLGDCRSLNNYFAILLSAGIETVRLFDENVASACADRLQLFIDGGYANTWIHTTKRISKSASALLKCSMNCKEFVATLLIQDHKTGASLGEKIIFHSKPDELIFDTKLGKIQAINQKIFLIDKFGNSVGFIDIPI